MALALVAPASALPVSGTDAYRGGGYVYQDYLFDAYGADTTPALGASTSWGSSPVFAPAAGDAQTGDEADLVSVRIVPRRDEIEYRVRLNTATDADAAVVGIGIDTDRSGGDPVAWPDGAGVATPGMDHFIEAWGTGGKLDGTPLAVAMDLASNVMTIHVPRALLDPGKATWRYVAGAGPWDGTGWSAGVFNLAFRFHEPAGSVPGTGAGLPGYTTAPGTGSWFEDGQARDLAAGTTGADFADVDFGAIGGRRYLHAPGRVQARVLHSKLAIPEGVDHDAFPEFGGPLQPYLVTLPEGYTRTRRWPVLFALHPSNAGYTTFNVFMPHWARQLGAGKLTVTLLDRGLNGPHGDTGEYSGAAEAGFFEAWRDVRRHFRVDASRVQLSGYSLGAYAAYHLAALYPDRFASVFSVVGAAPTNGVDLGLMGNLRWVPVLAWNQADDALVPYTDAKATADALDAAGLRHEQWTFAAGNHLGPALRDEWAPAAAQIGAPRVRRRPPRVTYAFDGPGHDRAYWVSGLRAAKPGHATVDARSLAFGRADAPTSTYSGEGSAGAPAVVTGRRWGAAPRVAPRNALELRLSNVRRIVVDARRAGLRRGARVSVRSDVPVRVVLRFRHGSVVQLQR